VTTPTLEADPACPDAGIEAAPPARSRDLVVRRQPFADIPRETWDRAAARNPWATPFASWAFHRAWWDGYGENAHEQTLVVVDPASPSADPAAIVPLMHRHAVEPSDASTHTQIRHAARAPLTSLPPATKTVFFGASYHADYATILGAPADRHAVAEAVAASLASDTALDPAHPMDWDAIDLRRLRCGDPSGEALATAFQGRAGGKAWTVDVEREDVCPVATIPPGVDFDGYLATLTKHHRHEIRRKLRRARGLGDVKLVESMEPIADLDVFVDIHQRRWGDEGLFPPTPGGEQSRTFLRRLFELAAPSGQVRLSFLSVGARRVGAAIHFQTADTIYYYNAGIEPEARELSPGVLLVERLFQRAIEAGVRRFDFMRGNEAYKYEWGGVDEPIQRVLVRRNG
jgi:CelD/BcsL family acetyltransferase involved in cellulose biosynthesis